MEAIAKSLVTYNGIVYALPSHLTGIPWKVNTTTLINHHLQLPPPLSDWGSAWWQKWNMSEFNRYLTVMYEGGERNLFNLPQHEGFQTFIGSQMFFYYGASLYNAEGRCGLDENALHSLEQTMYFVLAFASMYWKANPGMIQLPTVGNITQMDEWLAAPLISPMLEKRPKLDHPLWDDPGWKCQGFDLHYCYGNECQDVFPPTGTAHADAVIAGIPTTAQSTMRSYEALVLAVATNSRLQVNTPQEGGGNGGISAWRSSKFAPELVNLLEHATFGGYPPEHKPGYAAVFNYDPLALAYAEILFKNVSAAKAMDRICVTVNYTSRPPCTSAEWSVSVIDDPANNQGTVNFTWINGVDNICRTDVATTAQIPAPISKYMVSTKIYGTSTIGKAVLAVSILGIIIEVLLVAGFCWYRNSEVIRAAAFAPSMLILFGGILTLLSVIMRISFDGKLRWAQCFGTYWFFALGFSSLLGSLALKSYRIDRIFRSKGRMVSISNAVLLLMIGCVNLGNVVWLLMYQFMITDNSKQRSQQLPNSNFDLVQEDCPVIHRAPSVLLYFYNTLVLAAAAVYAFRTRNVVSSFNESLFTAAATMLITVITIVIVPVLQ
ncbi:hypothetical protein HDV00_005033, partial [Rhizophlyctis rosea]